MARWRLTGKHYLNVPGTEWDYKETSRDTGKQVRRVFPVPLYLDPEDPGDCNYSGEIIVSDGNGAQPKDIIFVGPPTADMEPLDPAAEALSAEHRAKWRDPKNEINFGGADSVLAALQAQLSAALSLKGSAPAAPVAINGVSPSEFAKLQEQVAALMARNAELEAAQDKKRRA